MYSSATDTYLWSTAERPSFVLVADLFCKAKINKFHVSLVWNWISNVFTFRFTLIICHQVLRLEISVDNAPGMKVVDGFYHTANDELRLALVEWALKMLKQTIMHFKQICVYIFI